jgi:PPOX class probable F420-dependent enzyme
MLDGPEGSVGSRKPIRVAWKPEQEREAQMASVLEQIPESHRDLLANPLTATLTTVDGQGRPQSTAVWYLIDDGALTCSTSADRQKYKNLSRNPSCSLLIIDPASPWRTLEIRAEAQLRADPDKAMISKFAKAYGADEDMLKAQGGDRFTITLEPRRVVANPPA